MRIIDSHTHLTRAGREDSFENAASALVETLARNGVSEALVIAYNEYPGGDASADLTANSPELLAAARGRAGLHLVGTPPVLDSRKEVDLGWFDCRLAEGTFVAVKLFPGDGPHYLTDERCEPVYRMCVKHRRPLIMHTGVEPGHGKYNKPEEIAHLARRYPLLRIVVAHYSWPKLDECYEVTKGVDNVYLDTTALAHEMLYNMCGGLEKVRGALRKTVLERPDNVVLGSDHPGCSMTGHIELVQSLRLPPELEDKVLYGNAARLFGLESIEY